MEGFQALRSPRAGRRMQISAQSQCGTAPVAAGVHMRTRGSVFAFLRSSPVPGAAGCGEKRCLIGRNRRLPQCWNPPHACTLPQFPSSPLLKFGRGPRSPPYALSWEESCPRSSGSTTFTLAPEPARHLPLFWAIAAECRTRFSIRQILSIPCSIGSLSTGNS